MKWYRKLHWQIILGMILGLVYGIAAAQFQWTGFATNWVVPFGDIFMNLLKLIAVPLVLTSLVAGVASLSDFKKLSRMGSKTIGLYIATTAVAVTIGLLVVNTLQPGAKLAELDDTQEELKADYKSKAESKEETAKIIDERGPLQPLIDMVPDNFFGSASSNSNMLQLVFVSLLIGIALVQVSDEHRKPVLSLFEGMQAVVIKLVNIIMLMAPIGVFALITKTITTLAVGEGGEANLGQIGTVLGALSYYCIAVIIGLLLHTTIVYLGLLKLFTPLKISQFFKAIAPAQLLAFSTSSSGATLPVTMRQCKEKLGASKETTSFVLPLGATINMDGTALYQAVAAVFIAQAYSIPLDLGAQITIILTAVMASIGTAAVPGAGIIMLVIILEAINVPTAGIALILGVDRILDMLRTATNVTGDAAVCAIIAHSEKQLHPPSE
ncbi:MAG: dicarboxylate/amino acid:cation symporter [Verrucomicrobia bacterium]|jgi:Na+/H+-dicarboxylate symporter|nr:dicarboxylate/amino acid:cation symporter [Verrucomicrobiota bacterium]MBT7909799.1 dicarboxylate/amino acid:cation symporter [Verrucomicrobiota bacterium]MDB4668573.1 dicarboxylate/amino acid:cation symporter [bacterium]MDC0319445.1 dicarboxylate/amino acid:cation symporter [Verrucomicrobiota bacterium]